MLVDYRWIQSDGPLERVERDNFVGPKGRMQWWYVDVLMEDGSVLMVAFVPRKWWPDTEGADLDDAFLMVALLRAGEDAVASVSATLDAGRLRCSEDGRSLEIPGSLTIARDEATYRFTFELDEVRGQLEVRPLVDRWSAFPRGTLPGWARAALLGGGSRRGGFHYVSSVPRGAASGELTLHGRPVAIDGLAYHEQGRFADPAEDLSRGWFWCHFLHPEWNVFGSPGMFLYVQHRDDPRVFGGFNLFGRRFELEDRRTARVPDHPRVYCGGALQLARNGVSLTIRAESPEQKPLISFPSSDSRQIYHTLVTPARLQVEHGGTAESFDGQMVFETCWLAR